MEISEASALEPWSPLMCSAGVFLARIFPSLAKAPASTASVLDSGANTRDLFKSFNPVGSLLKTCLLSELEAMTGSRMTWRQQATPCKHSWSVLTILARRTDANECGLLPTPKNSGHRSGMPNRHGGRRSNLNDTVAALLPTPSATSYGTNKGGAAGRVGPEQPSLERMAGKGMLPTPTRSDSNRSGAAGYSTESGRRSRTTLTDAIVRGYLPTPSATSYGTNKGGSAGRVGPGRPSLERMAKRGMLLTPSARDWKSNHASPQTMARNARPLNEVATNGDGAKRLNPQFVEWMMGFPEDWTRIAGRDWRRLGTRSCRKSQSASAARSFASSINTLL